jgi:16S rRNA (guanine(527)-N(7))-methyltransferase RsmG
VEPLTDYLALVSDWSQRVNLTAADSDEERVRVLIRPVLDAAPWVEGPDLIDVGTGNGSPGLVLALLRPELGVTLLEPRLRRWVFLREALRVLDRRDVRLVRTRHDGYTGPAAQTVTLRAVRLRLPALEPLVRQNGRVVVLGSRPGPAGPFTQEPGPAAGIHVYRHTG